MKTGCVGVTLAKHHDFRRAFQDGHLYAAVKGTFGRVAGHEVWLFAEDVKKQYSILYF